MKLPDCLLLLVVAVGAGDLAIASFHIPNIVAVGGSGTLGFVEVALAEVVAGNGKCEMGGVVVLGVVGRARNGAVGGVRGVLEPTWAVVARRVVDGVVVGEL
jgi:hypothetical protein